MPLADGIQLHFIINHIGELFTILVLLELLISNTSLSSSWYTYHKNLKAFIHIPESVDFIGERYKLPEEAESYKALSSAIDNITSKLMNDDIVQNTLKNLMTLRKSLVDKNCSMVSAEFIQYLRQAIANLDKLVQDKPNVSNMYKCIKINALYVLCSHLFGNIEKKIFKSLIDLNTKVYTFDGSLYSHCF